MLGSSHRRESNGKNFYLFLGFVRILNKRDFESLVFKKTTEIISVYRKDLYFIGEIRQVSSKTEQDFNRDLIGL